MKPCASLGIPASHSHCVGHQMRPRPLDKRQTSTRHLRKGVRAQRAAPPGTFAGSTLAPAFVAHACRSSDPSQITGAGEIQPRLVSLPAVTRRPVLQAPGAIYILRALAHMRARHRAHHRTRSRRARTAVDMLNDAPSYGSSTGIATKRRRCVPHVAHPVGGCPRKPFTEKVAFGSGDLTCHRALHPCCQFRAS